MLLLIAAVVLFILAAIAANENVEIIVSAAVLGYAGLACFAAAHLPVGDWIRRP
jgi:hypothetical protein